MSAVIKVKGTVRPRGLWIMAACANVAAQLGVAVTVTSGNDSKHMKGSLHYTGDALDVRSKSPFKTRAAKRDYLARVLARLGTDYQGILEGEGTPNEHFHFEFDPPKEKP